MIKREFIIPQRVCALGIQPPWDSSAPQIPGVSVACALTQEDAACLWPSSPKGSKKNSDSKQLRVSHKTFLCSMTGRDPESGCRWLGLASRHPARCWQLCKGINSPDAHRNGHGHACRNTHGHTPSSTPRHPSVSCRKTQHALPHPLPPLWRAAQSPVRPQPYKPAA